MYLRLPKPGDWWPAFWGCSQYRTDECDGTRKIQDETGEPYPDDFTMEDAGYRLNTTDRDYAFWQKKEDYEGDE